MIKPVRFCKDGLADPLTHAQVRLVVRRSLRPIADMAWLAQASAAVLPESIAPSGEPLATAAEKYVPQRNYQPFGRWI
jgi:hypothetical protein